MRILLQFPEGLKQKAIDYADKLEKEGHEVFISASPSYGACDLAINEARKIKAKKIIHFGHNQFYNLNVKDIEIEYIPYRIDISVEWPKLINRLKDKHIKSISIGTTVQHSHQIEEIKDYFEKHGFIVKMGKGIFAKEKGQILGCDAKALQQDVDAYIIIADGLFHAYGVEEFIKLDKPIYLLNPYSKKFKLINKELKKIRKKKLGAIARAITSNIFGIIVSTKPGQYRLSLAESIKKKLNSLGKKAYILITSEVMPEPLINFMHFDAFIVTACPRLVDDTERFGKPILNIKMFSQMMEMLNKDFNASLAPEL